MRIYTHPQGIRTKLLAAQRHDKPRWGDWPEKLSLEYIASLVRTGGWFDGKHKLIPADQGATPRHLYAPEYFLRNERNYSYLLTNPYVADSYIPP